MSALALAANFKNLTYVSTRSGQVQSLIKCLKFSWLLFCNNGIWNAPHVFGAFVPSKLSMTLLAWVSQSHQTEYSRAASSFMKSMQLARIWQSGDVRWPYLLQSDLFSHQGLMLLTLIRQWTLVPTELASKPLLAHATKEWQAQYIFMKINTGVFCKLNQPFLCFILLLLKDSPVAKSAWTNIAIVPPIFTSLLVDCDFRWVTKNIAHCL